MDLKEKLRRFRRRYRHFRKPDAIRIGGVKISTDLRDIDEETRLELYREFYEAIERRLVEEYLSPKDRVLELGAGVGYIGICCARICGANNVLSYEPNKKLHSVIEKNYRLNNLKPNVRQKAIGRSQGEISFFISDHFASSSIYNREHTSKHSVRCDAIGEVVAEFRPTVIVMDIEGAEVDLLHLEELSGVEKIIIEVHPHIVGETKINNLIENLERFGFFTIKRISKRLILARSC